MLTFASEERARKIAAYGNAYTLLLEALTEFPREMWAFRPAPDQWTIHEILVHIADSEANSYVRCRRLIAEPGSPVLGYDEMEWARTLNYAAQDVDAALELFAVLRRQSYRLIVGQPESVWAHTIVHSENGPMSMDDWLDVYERHVPEHLEQMRIVYAAWLSAQA